MEKTNHLSLHPGNGVVNKKIKLFLISTWLTVISDKKNLIKVIYNVIYLQKTQCYISLSRWSENVASIS